MNAVGAVCGVVIGAVFVWSGASKLRAGDNWRVAGTPFSTARPGVDRIVERALPWIEIVLGAVLMAQISPVFFGAVAGVLLVVFTIALVRVVLRGEATPCMCFGSASRTNVSWRHVVRNLGLIALAMVTAFAA